jgi:oxalate decarboxylase/phosphoglucose isomerase-like protein (cupin superfamily)
MAHIKPAEVETFSLDWGTMKWFVSPVTLPGAANSQGEVIVNPGQGHARHLHEQADELIYVISGTGTQTVGDEEFPIAEGDTVYIPMGTLHSTLNTGWRTLRLIVTYTPGGEEQALTSLPDFTRHPAGEIVGWERTAGQPCCRRWPALPPGARRFTRRGPLAGCGCGRLLCRRGCGRWWCRRGAGLRSSPTGE